jgi:sialate O-acetylesterase
MQLRIPIKWFFIPVLSLILQASIYANVRVARIFSDNMVLQRDINAPVWGSADPGEQVSVTIDGLTVSTRAEADGSWRVYLPVFTAGGPYEVVVSGKNEVRFTDVLFGDVWVASGQSNMEWRLENSNNGQQEVNDANYPQIRMFYVPKRVGITPKDDLDGGQWDKCTPEVAKSFSAVAYFFGRELHQDINVPIGLVNCNWGGTVAEAWTSAEILKSLPDFEERVLALENGPNWEEDIEANNQRSREKSKIINESFNGLEEGVIKINYGTNDWPTVIVPHWEDELEGIVWMRKMIEVPREFKGQELKFDLGRIENNVAVYFNEVKLGVTNSPYFTEYTVPAKLVRAGKNVIALRVLHRWGRPNFSGPEDRMKLYAPNGAVLEDLSGPWKYRTGLEPDFPEIKGYQNYPSSLFNGMLDPIIPYGIKGAIWYQGESNAGRAYQYRSLFQSMIEDWRIRWGQGYFPFLFVQLANFMDIPEQPEDSDWAELREAQTMALRLPNTGMAVTMDIGERFDIHPRNKQDVGHRLALAAKKIAYGHDIIHSGPLYSGMEINGKDIEIAFEYVGNGLMMKGEKLKGFQIAGKDRKFYWADAQIVGGEVFVSSDKVSEPVAVRYNWSINMDGNLFNKNGLPASSFRTDDWPGTTLDRK